MSWEAGQIFATFCVPVRFTSQAEINGPTGKVSGVSFQIFQY